MEARVKLLILLVLIIIHAESMGIRIPLNDLLPLKILVFTIVHEGL